MTDLELFEFDRTGYLKIPELLSRDEVSCLRGAVDALISDAEKNLDLQPRVTAPSGAEYHRNNILGYHVSGSLGNRGSLLVEDFFNVDPTFDCLVNHNTTMSYIEAIVQDRPAINNSELRVRYPGNATGAHMGGPGSSKHRFRFIDNRVECMMVRMVYFLHDVSAKQGAFCVVPGTHKSNFRPPYLVDRLLPEDEPGMLALPAKMGDGILFTENLRHGGVTNYSTQVRKTLHIGFGPFWLKSQNIATMDSSPYILNRTLERYDNKQKQLFNTFPVPK
tara:strand:+ start:3905 stop:4735 length:831 start_codon:yes stop_codon:yes gene_type:complete